VERCDEKSDFPGGVRRKSSEMPVKLQGWSITSEIYRSSFRFLGAQRAGNTTARRRVRKTPSTARTFPTCDFCLEHCGCAPSTVSFIMYHKTLRRRPWWTIFERTGRPTRRTLDVAVGDGKRENRDWNGTNFTGKHWLLSPNKIRKSRIKIKSKRKPNKSKFFKNYLKFLPTTHSDLNIETVDQLATKHCAILTQIVNI